MSKQKISEIVFRTAYDTGRRRQVTCFEGVQTVTHQEQKETCDINNILEKYARTGLINHVNKYEGQYADVSAIDYQTMQNQVAQVNSMFAELPAKERQRFNNDPQTFLEFVSQQSNIDDMKDGVIGNNSPEASSVTSGDDSGESAEGEKE